MIYHETEAVRLFLNCRVQQVLSSLYTCIGKPMNPMDCTETVKPDYTSLQKQRKQPALHKTATLYGMHYRRKLCRKNTVSRCLLLSAIDLLLINFAARPGVHKAQSAV